MGLPTAEELRGLLQAARDCGVQRLRVGPLDVTFHPKSVVEEINQAAPLPASQPDPLDIIRRNGTADARREPADILEALASGARLVETDNPDPTAPS